MGKGRQDFFYSALGAVKYSKSHGKYRIAFYSGEFDYRKTDWIYGNGVLYYVDEQDKPLGFSTGFFEGLTRTGDYVGEFDYTTLAKGYDGTMEFYIDERYELFCAELDNYRNVEGEYNLFLGDSYFEFWHYEDVAGKDTFYKVFANAGNLNLGLGGTTYYDWLYYAKLLSSLRKPRNIIVNLGFNDIHCGRTAEEAFSHCKEFIAVLKSIFGNVNLYLLTVVSAPCFVNAACEEERFNGLLLANADNLDITVLDGRTPIGQLQQTANCFIGDEVHLNAVGYKALGKLISEVLK